MTPSLIFGLPGTAPVSRELRAFMQWCHTPSGMLVLLWVRAAIPPSLTVEERGSLLYTHYLDAKGAP